AGRATAEAQTRILNGARERIEGAARAGLQKAKTKMLSEAETPLLAVHRHARDAQTDPAGLDAIVMKLVPHLGEQAGAAAETEAAAVLAEHRPELDAAAAAGAAMRAKVMADDLAQKLHTLLDAVARTAAEQACQADPACRARAEAERRAAELRALD